MLLSTTFARYELDDGTLVDVSTSTTYAITTTAGAWIAIADEPDSMFYLPANTLIELDTGSNDTLYFRRQDQRGWISMTPAAAEA